MQEVMMALHKVLFRRGWSPPYAQPKPSPQRFLSLEDSFQRQFLEKGMHALQRRSGPLKSIPDEFVITSLDVVVHHDKKLGEGGYGEVFQGDWHGTTVAVKVLEKGVPPFVSLTSSGPLSCSLPSFRCSREKLMCGRGFATQTF
jgi:hypothetical protein